MSNQGNDLQLDVPPNVFPGRPISADDANKIRKGLKALAYEVRSRTVVPSKFFGATRGPGGTVLNPKAPEGQWEKVKGFMPVARNMGPEGDRTPGVGMVLGRVCFLHVFTDGENDQPRNAPEVAPVLAGDPLDAEIPPRVELTAGEWDAYIYFKRYSAWVVFSGSGLIPPEPAPDERACQVSRFHVTLPDDPEAPQIPRIRIIEQTMRDEIQAWEHDSFCDSSSSCSSSSGSSSSDSSSGGGSGGGSGSDSSSSKDTAVVPVPRWFHKGEESHAALFTMESPEVLFFDLGRVPIAGRKTGVEIDPRFLQVCEPGTVEVYSALPDRCAAIGGRVEGPELILETAWFPFRRPREAKVILAGTRKGFKPAEGWRFPPRNEQQYEANEAWLDRGGFDFRDDDEQRECKE